VGKVKALGGPFDPDTDSDPDADAEWLRPYPLKLRIERPWGNPSERFIPDWKA
jgi:hypothetical protein